jgi:DNA-binding CsgD family transcriptional regulator
MAMSRTLPNLAGNRSAARLGRITASLDGRMGETIERNDQRPFDLLMAGFEALDLVNIGLLVTSASGQLLLANHTAEQVLDCGDGLERTARGDLRTSKRCTPNLSLLMQQAGNPSAQDSPDSILAVERPSGKRPLTLLIRSLGNVTKERDPLAPAALIFVLDPESPVGTAEAELRQLYGLTSTEASLANLLMEGKTLDECCVALDIRRSTARTHLQHLFEKVGVQRQSELVSLLLKSIGLVRTRASVGERG